MEKLKVRRSNTFVKDVVRARKRGFDIRKLDEVIEKLANRETLDKHYHDHPLVGNYGDYRECHIKPDWLLIYYIDDKQLRLFLFRTGTHSDLLEHNIMY